MCRRVRSLASVSPALGPARFQDAQSGEWFVLPQNDIEVCGIRCGGRSALNVKRAENTGLGSDCCTATDVDSLCAKLEGPSCDISCTLRMLLGFSTEFAGVLDDRGFTFVTRAIEATEHGGCQRRARCLGLALRRGGSNLGPSQSLPPNSDVASLSMCLASKCFPSGQGFCHFAATGK